ncbi:MAG: ZIP family metal transporter [Candidatus Binatia bacterium]
MLPLTQALIATVLVSAISLIGIVFFFTKWSARRGMFFMSFAAGVLLATTFLNILPEALDRHEQSGNVFTATLAAMAAFFVLERVLHATHDHQIDESHALPSGYLILVGDTLHNFIDGIAIAATFLIDPALGITTTLAIAAHEIPQEIADYGVLISSRFSRRSALLLNTLSGLAAVAGAVTCGWFQGPVEQHLSWFMAATAGMFVYVAATDLMPELHHAGTRDAWLGTISFFAGVLLIAAMGTLIPHAH